MHVRISVKRGWPLAPFPSSIPGHPSATRGAKEDTPRRPTPREAGPAGDLLPRDCCQELPLCSGFFSLGEVSLGQGAWGLSGGSPFHQAPQAQGLPAQQAPLTPCLGGLQGWFLKREE